MAVSRSLKQFSRRMRIRADQIVDGVERLVQKGALVADESVVLGTPVDTGRARGNWIPSIGSPQRGIRSPDKNGASTIARARQVIPQYKINGNGIFITNNISYILLLENGSSQQAPNGMAKQAIQAATVAVKRDKVFKR